MEYNALSIDRIEVSADSGAHVTVVARQAVLLALSEDRHVFIAFNGHPYTIKPADVLDPVIGGLMGKQEGGSDE